MPLIATREPDHDFEPAPAGTQVARLQGIYDIGTQQTPFTDTDGGIKRTRQLYFNFELGAIMTNGKPFIIGRFYTFSLHEKASLCQDIEAWRNKPFSEDELKNGYDIGERLGKPCLLGIVHSSNSEGKVKAKPTSIMGLPAGMNAPELFSPPVYFSLAPGDFSQEQFEKVPQWLRDKIILSPEYALSVRAKEGRGQASGGRPSHVSEGPDY